MNIFENKLGTHFKYTAILFVLISAYIKCTPVKSSHKEMNSEAFAHQTGEWVMVGEVYSMLIPHGCMTNKGEGDDSDFLEIRNEKGDLVISRETGVDIDDMLSKPKDLNALNKEYEFTEIIKTLSEVNIRIAYKKTNATFRNIEGRVYTEQKDELSELLRFSCNDTQLDNVYKILLTLKLI